ncbi:hypothetical protein GCM10007301_40510 [Azorhizobium oxalatiphilum]|uniref:Beta-lactamase-related domain-containing protein n=1 Tax=Azorhizobium oxalatiphilum TaxID=980631 RepID=A0A917C7U0_9HYPH|nr:serine hydrolase domain-containing protein [Azorhizobium oxalatiphilum]GGF76526.1 hypothetical protein GCM10007301_40510 [Azorhizobium oxalatiphilum]
MFADRRPVVTVLILALALTFGLAGFVPAARAQDDIRAKLEELNEGLSLTGPDRMGLRDAMTLLHITSVSLAVVEGGKLAEAGALGSDSSVSPFQAGTLSKFVTAIAALRLVEDGRLSLDGDVNAQLKSWHIPESEFTRGHPVTLRGLLSMTAGIGVPAYAGYPPGSRIPTLKQILAGDTWSNAPPIKVERVPGSGFAYSAGSYEVIQQLIEDVTRLPFATAMEALVLKPTGMIDSFFRQPPPKERAYSLALGHEASGTALVGGWRVLPELAATGLWSTPADLARLMVIVSAAYRGEANALLKPETARLMFTAQAKGPYGLGIAVAGTGNDLIAMKRGQSPGYQAYMLFFPQRGQGMVIMTGSESGNVLVDAILKRATGVFGWPAVSRLED